jgi:hypothetical protein
MNGRILKRAIIIDTIVNGRFYFCKCSRSRRRGCVIFLTGEKNKYGYKKNTCSFHLLVIKVIKNMNGISKKAAFYRAAFSDIQSFETICLPVHSDKDLKLPVASVRV